jgi:radical SAM protein with 4Fe4S-binding SPASM domain
MFKKILKLWRQQIWLKHRDQIIKNSTLRYLFWECTMNCNFRCKHCWSNGGDKVYDESLSTQEIKNALLDISKNFNAKKITIAVTWWEPLLRKDLFEVMEYAVSLWFNWWMVTNGFFINDNVIEKMKKSKMRTIEISIDWLEEQHDVFRNQKWSFHKNINALKKLIKADFLKPLSVTTTVNKTNIWSIDKMYELFSEIWLKDWRLLHMDPIGRWESESKDLLLDKAQANTLFDFVKQKRKQWWMRVVTWCAHYLWEEYEDDVRNHFFICNTWISIGSILHNGDIFVCPNVPREAKLIQWNVKKDSFSEVWNNKYEFFRNKDRISNEKCNDCEHWEECLWWSLHSFDFKKNEQKVCFLQD